MPYEYISSDGSVRLMPVRHYDPDTYKERLIIEIEVNNESHGEIVCGILTLEKDLQQLREQGTGFSRPDIVTIRRELESHIIEIDRVRDAKPSDPIELYFDSIIDMYNNYISENDVLWNDDKTLCHIPVKDFSDYLATSDYRSCDELKLRERLRDEGYIKANKGRTSNNVRVGDGKEPKKVISFNVEDCKIVARQ